MQSLRQEKMEKQNTHLLQPQAMTGEYVILLHGLARTSRSMAGLGKFLTRRGYRVLNLDYPSRKYPIATLAKNIRKEVVKKTSGAGKLHFITHSMGGIILRHIQKNDPLPGLVRAVMLSPPNHGSEVVDRIGHTRLFQWINGPAGKELGTGRKGLCRTLGRVDFELGIITGDCSINWINSLIIPGKDDGKVSVESAKIAGMKEFLIVHAPHPLIMNHKKVMISCVNFLQSGFFSPGGFQATILNIPSLRQPQPRRPWPEKNHSWTPGRTGTDPLEKER